MALYFIKDTTLTGIADAIREKTGTTDPIPVTDMATQISGITGGGTPSVKTEILTAIGSFRMGETPSKSVTIEHTLGVKPDLIIVTMGVAFDGEGDGYHAWIYTSSKIGLGQCAVAKAFTNHNSTWFGANDSTFTVLSDNADGFEPNTSYMWRAAAIVDVPVIGGGDHTVTFMSEDGQTVLGTKSVMNGDTCGDPISAGLIDTPTKESTAQYEYTFNGWSLTAGGDADANALVNVTEDRTVYAAFASEVRYYTIRFYDGEILLHTMICEYGTTPNYMPSVDGKVFDRWQPEIVAVTGDADYVAKWAENLASGTCGTNLIWKLANNGVLTISGTGAMNDYTASYVSNPVYPPWKDYGSSITSVVVEEGVTTIGKYAFYYENENIKSVTIPSSVKTIDQQAFNGCSNLSIINLAEGVTTIQTSAFNGTGVESITIPASVKTFGSQVFDSCKKLTTVVFLSNLTTWGDSTFDNCTSLKNVTLPSGITDIVYRMFRYSAIENITIPASVKIISSEAFYSCNALASVIFENTTGWTHRPYKSSTDKTAVSSAELADPATASTLLLANANRYWERT